MTLKDSVWTSVEEITEDVVKIAGELELEMEPKNLIELMQPYDKTTDEQLLLLNEQRKMVSWYGITPGENAVKIVEIATEDLEYDRNLVGKIAA